MIAFKSIFPCSERVLADGNIHEDIFLYMEQNSSICREPAENTHHGNPTMVQLQAHRPLLTTKIVSHALLPFWGRKEQKVLLEQHRPVHGRPVLLLLLCDSSQRAGMKGNGCNTVLPEGLHRGLVHSSGKSGPSRVCSVCSVYKGGLLTAASFLQCSFSKGGQTSTKTYFLNQKDHKNCRRGKLQQKYKERNYRLRVHFVCFRPFQKGEWNINLIYSASYMRFMPPSYHQSGKKQPEVHR